MDASTQAAPLPPLPGPDQLPEELRGPTPRPRPAFVRQSPLAAKRLNVFLGCMVAGGMCLVLSPLPFVKTMSLYLLPLEYLTWIGLGLCAIGALIYGSGAELKRACNYLEEGEAAFGRVKSLVKKPTLLVHGQSSTYALFAAVEVRHPETGETCLREVKSRDFSASKKDRVNTRFRVGDAIPVVWLPHKFEKTVQIYDFLDVSPEASLQWDRPKSAPLWQTIALTAFGVAFMFALFWNVYAIGRFQPLDFEFMQGLPIFALGAVVSVAALIACYVFAIRKRREVATRNQEAIAAGEAVELQLEKKPIRGGLFAIILVLGAALLGGATVLCWAMTANALLDKSPARPVPVRITDMIQETTDFIYREYKMKYRRAEDKSDQTLLTTPDNLNQFQLPIGIAQVRQGRFGWPWVETIDPLPGNPIPIPLQK
jgi:hypothetical protein